MERGILMDEQEKTQLDPQVFPEERPHYTPRPRWQIILAWALLAATVLAVAAYYYWIAYRYV